MRNSSIFVAAFGVFAVAACASDPTDSSGVIAAPSGTADLVAPLAIAAAPKSFSVTVSQGANGANASVAVTLTGRESGRAAWSATSSASWDRLNNTSGRGNGTVSWSRRVSTLTPGLHVDTIRIVASGAPGAPALVLDSVRITGVSTPTALSVSPKSRSVAVVQGSIAAGSNAAVALTGTAGATTTWNASSRKSWTLLTTKTGTGNGTVAWSRNATGLTAGTYVDTITVTAVGPTGSPATVIDSIVVTAPGTGGTRPDLGLNADFHGRRFFPATSLWNLPVDTAQVDPNSAGILGAIGLTKSLHPDFGANWNGGPFGIPYVVVPDAQSRSPVSFDYASESDVGPYPIPANPPVEGGSDGHLLMVTQDDWKLYELFGFTSTGSGWHAGSGAIWNLATGAYRPAGWTSADAAGLPILPGLVRYDEVYLHGLIDHALRFTVQRSRHAYLAPASHYASSSTNALYAPMGMRVRLRAGFNIAAYPAPAQVVLRALQKYGMIVADNGSDFFLSGTADARWDDNVINLLKQVKVSDFEVVKMTGIVTQ